MNALFPLSLFVLSLLFVGCTEKGTGSGGANVTSAVHEDPEGYYTCSMHPEVHEHAPGKCPICGMALTKVSNKKDTSRETGSGSVQISEFQMSLAGISKYKVERKDLSFSVPVSGRMGSSREVSLQVYESDVQAIHPGQSFSGSSTAQPDKVLQGKIRQIDTLVDPSSRTVRVLGVLSAPAERVLIDGGFHGEIIVDLKSQLSVPLEAVLHAGTKDLVYVIGDGGVTPKSIVLGKKSKDSYQVISGVSEGEVISSGPNFLIDSEAKIRGGNDKTHH